MRDVYAPFDDFTGGGFSGRKNTHISTGPFYKEMYVETNLNNDQLTQVALTIDGDPVIDVTGDHLRMLEAYKGNHQKDGVFVIPFSDFTGRTQDGQDLTGLVTNAGENIVLSIKVGAATQAQLDAGLIPEVKAYGRMGETRLDKDGNVLKRELISRMYSDIIEAGSTGKINYSTFQRGPRLRRAHMYNANITDLEVRRDRMPLIELTKDQNDFLLKRNGRTPQDGIFHLDPIQTGFNMTDILKTEGDSFVISPTLSQAGDFSVLFETIERA